MCNRVHKPRFNSLPLWLLILAFSFTSRHVFAADTPPPGSLGRITTVDGKAYDKVTVQKVDPDGLLVAFVPAEGGSGSAKLKFRNLPKDLQQRFGYDPARASDYETAHARGEANWQAENAVRTEQLLAAQAEQAALEREMRAKAEARLAAEAEQARADAAYNQQQEPTYYYPYGSSWWLRDFNHRGPGLHHNHTPPQMPAGNTPSPTSPTMSPMRPSGK